MLSRKFAQAGRSTQSPAHRPHAGLVGLGTCRVIHGLCQTNVFNLARRASVGTMEGLRARTSRQTGMSATTTGRSLNGALSILRFFLAGSASGFGRSYTSKVEADNKSFFRAASHCFGPCCFQRQSLGRLNVQGRSRNDANCCFGPCTLRSHFAGPAT